MGALTRNELNLKTIIRKQLQASDLQPYLKRGSGTGVFLSILRNL